MPHSRRSFLLSFSISLSLSLFSSRNRDLRVISDLKSLLHHFLPSIDPPPSQDFTALLLLLLLLRLHLRILLLLLRLFLCFVFLIFLLLSLSLSSVLEVRLCFWLGSGVIGSPKPVLIIDPPAWQLPAKPLSTSCVPAQFPTLRERDLPRSVSTEVPRAGRRRSREGVWPLLLLLFGCLFGTKQFMPAINIIYAKREAREREREKEKTQRFLYIKYTS